MMNVPAGISTNSIEMAEGDLKKRHPKNITKIIAKIIAKPKAVSLAALSTISAFRIAGMACPHSGQTSASVGILAWQKGHLICGGQRNFLPATAFLAPGKTGGAGKIGC
jgi:hypothetical protein